MKKLSRIRLPIVMLLIAIMILGSTVSVFASAPKIKKVEYEGKGKVEVDFAKKVSYKNVKVTVTDTQGNKYTATIVDKDKDDLTFKIKKYKTGRTYNFKITGVKVRGTSKYGTVKGTVTIPKPAATTVSKTKAISAAVEHAKTNLKATAIRKKEAEKDRYNGEASWDVEFEGKIGGKWYEFDYDISRSTGKILNFTYELDT